MFSILDKLAMHDPSVEITEADVQSAYDLDAVTYGSSLDHLIIARRCLISFLQTRDEFYLSFARMELLKVRWA